MLGEATRNNEAVLNQGRVKFSKVFGYLPYGIVWRNSVSVLCQKVAVYLGHFWEHGKIQGVLVRHLQCLWLLFPALLYTLIFKVLFEISVLVGPSIVALKHRNLYFILSAGPDNFWNYWKGGSFENSYQGKLWVGCSPFIWARYITIHKLRSAFLFYDFSIKLKTASSLVDLNISDLFGCNLIFLCFKN